MAVTHLSVAQYEYWYNTIKNVMLLAGFNFTATRVNNEITELYLTKDATIADEYISLIQYHLNLTLLDITLIDVTSSTDKVKITIDKTATNSAIDTRNAGYDTP